MARSKHDMPDWFPFALVASGLIAIGAGIRSNWGRTKTAAEPPSPNPQTSPSPVQAGVLHDWAGIYRG